MMKKLIKGIIFALVIGTLITSYGAAYAWSYWDVKCYVKDTSTSTYLQYVVITVQYQLSMDGTNWVPLTRLEMSGTTDQDGYKLMKVPRRYNGTDYRWLRATVILEKTDFPNYYYPVTLTNIWVFEGENDINYIFSMKKDTDPPITSVSPLPEVTNSTNFAVSWTGADPTYFGKAGSGIKANTFLVQYKDGAGGTWTTWKTTSGAGTDTFNGVDGHTYYFRCKATDNNNNAEPYPATYDTYTTVQVIPTGFDIYGTVTLNGTSEHSGVTVYLWENPGYSATTAYDGTYIIHTVPSGEWSVIAEKPEWTLTPHPRAVRVVDADVPDIDFTGTQVTYTISGTVIGGFSGINIFASRDGGPYITTTTGPSGAYTLSGPDLIAGDYIVDTPYESGYTIVPAGSWSNPVTVNSAVGNANGIDFLAYENSYTLVGRVTESNGTTGIAGVTIRRNGGDIATTGADGRFNVDFHPSGTYSFSAVKTGYTFETDGFNNPVTLQPFFNVWSPAINFKAVGASTYTISGTVTLQGQSDCSGVTVSDGTRSATTNTSGSYTITEVPNGSYNLLATKGGWSISPSNFGNPISVSGANVTNKNFSGTEAATTYSIRGFVTLVGPYNPASVLVSCSGTGFSDYPDVNGFYEISGLPDGSYTVIATLNGFDIQPSNFTNPVIIAGGNQVDKNFLGEQIPTTNPTLQVVPSDRLDFFCDVGDISAPDQYFTISNIGTGTLNWTAITNSSWLYIESVAQAEISGAVDAGNIDPIRTQPYNAAGFPVKGTSATSIDIDAPAGTPGAPENILVYLHVGVPHIIRLSPEEGPVPSSVSVIGGNFGDTKGGSTLFFDDMAVDDSLITHWSDNLIIFTATASTLGEKNVWVLVGGEPSNVETFNVTSIDPNHGRPSIKWLSPISGEAGTSITLFGENFGNIKDTVVFDGANVAASDITFWADTMIIFTVPYPIPSGVTGLKDIYVEAGGQQSNTVQFDVTSLDPNSNRPNIRSVNPPEGATNISVALIGDNFGTSPGELYFNSQLIAHDTWNDTQITFTVPSSANMGANEIYVKRAAYSSNTVVYTVTTPGTGPTITSINPTNGPANISVTLIGYNFGGTRDTLLFGGTDYTSNVTFWEDNQIIFTIPSNVFPGSIYNVQVEVASELSNTKTFTATQLIGNQPPSIERIVPSSGPVGISVSLIGNNFGDTQGTLYFGGAQISSSVTFWTDKQIIFTVPLGASLGPKDIFVIAQGKSSNMVRYDVTNTSEQTGPSIQSLSPHEGPVGISVTLFGKNFGEVKGLSTLFFDGLNPTVTFWSDIQIIFTVPSSPPIDSIGLKDIYVIVGGVQSNTVVFDVISLMPNANIPSITSIIPDSGPVGATVTIEGTYFGATQGSSDLYFEGYPISIISWTDTRIVFIVPQTTTGTKEVFVRKGVYDSNTVLFTVSDVTQSIEGVFNYPNPFNPVIDEETIFEFGLEEATNVGVYVYDLGGRLMWKQEEVLAIGQVIWDGYDMERRIVGNGPYLAVVMNLDNGKLIGRCKPFVAK